MKFKFKDLEEPVYTSDTYYDLFEGGYIDFSEIVEDENQVKALQNAKELIEEFLRQAQHQGVLELG